MSTRIEDLDEPFRGKIVLLMTRLAEQGIKHTITETRRGYLAQAGYFAKGTSKCDGWKKLSMHQAGLAVDIVPLDQAGKPTWDYVKYADAFKQIGAAAKACGLEWGGDWQPIDPRTGLGWDAPHCEFKG